MNQDDELIGLRALKMQQIRLGLDKFDSKPAHRSVELFSTQTCPYCHMAERYLLDKKVSFQKNDVGKDQAAAKRMIDATGEMGVPQLHINGHWIVGFDRKAIDEALAD